MKTLAGPQTGCGERAELVVEPAEPRDQLGGGGDHARLVRGSHDLVDRRPCAADDGLPGGRAPAGDRQDVAKRLGEQDGVADDGRRGSAGRAGGRRPRGPRAGRGRSAGPSRRASAPASRSAQDASTAAAMPPFMSEAPLPVSWPSSTRGRHERQVDRVEMAVELERRPRPAALEPDRRRPAPSG